MSYTEILFVLWYDMDIIFLILKYFESILYIETA